jgi:putative CocE/NonD family hydrolase
VVDTPALVVTEEQVAMRDGVRLATDVVRPDDAARRPVLLVRTPYSRPGVWSAHDPAGWARRGWAVVLQDVRGRGQSEGTFRPFHQEVDDGFDTIAWCAEQPWSDGRVAMTGMSYNGATQWLAALSRPPALKAISPSVIGADFLEEFAFEGGAYHQGFMSAWALALAATGTDPEVVVKAAELIREWPGVLGDDSGRKAIAEVLPDYADWVPRQPDYWSPVNVAAALPDLDLPVWRLAGWFDLFCEGTLSAYASCAETMSAPQRLIVGPWTHARMHEQATPEVDFGFDALGVLLAAEMGDFLRAALDGTEAKTGATVFVMGDNAWRDLTSWPPPSAAMSLRLGADGVLVDSDPEPGAVSWQHDPADPVPTRGGRTLQGGLPMAGPVDQRPNEARPDVLTWSSQVLDEDITVIGTLTAELELRSTAVSYDVIVKVCDVQPDGRSMSVVDGVRRVTNEPGQTQLVDVRVGSTAMTFQRGHRIRVTLASSDSPRLDLLPAAEQTVLLGRSAVTLPVVERERSTDG